MGIKETPTIPTPSNSKIILPSYSERAFFIGGTGCGKTELAMTMAEHYHKVVYIDPQNNLEPKVEFTTLRTLDEFSWNRHMKSDKHIVFAPKAKDQNPALFNKLFYMMHCRGKPKNKKTGLFDNPFLIYSDEGFALADGHVQGYPVWARKIMVLDRQKGIGFWSAAQRPTLIPPELRSECAYYYVFFIASQKDIDVMSDYARPSDKFKEVMLQQQLDHRFIIVTRKTATFEYHEAIKI